MGAVVRALNVLIMCERQRREVLIVSRQDLIDAENLGIHVLEELRKLAEDNDEIVINFTE